MTEIGVQFSITDAPLQVVTKTTTARRRKRATTATTGNLFNQTPRSHQMQCSAVLPIISLSTISDFKEKLIRMASTNKSTKQTIIRSPTPTEFRLQIPSPDMSQTKPRSTSPNRPAASNIPKSSLSYPTIIPRPTTPYRSYSHQQQQPGARLLYVVNTPAFPHRATSARIPSSHNSSPLHQQPHILASPLLPRPHPQYGHFLAYLRRQSLARVRRKQQQQQQQQEVNVDSIETTISFNPPRLSPPLFHSTSNFSFATLPTETSSMPAINVQSKRKTRTLSSYRLFPRSLSSTTNYRLNFNQSPPLKQPLPSPRLLTKKSPDDQSLLLPSHTSVLITPTNSIVDEAIITPTKKAPYELELSGDMLNYCYVSDSGVKYQGQLLSTPV
jgi:hypothetical protein